MKFRLIDGREHIIDVNDDLKVGDLRIKIAEKLETTERVRIIHRGRAITDDSLPIGEAGLSNDSVINVVLAPPQPNVNNPSSSSQIPDSSTFSTPPMQSMGPFLRNIVTNIAQAVQNTSDGTQINGPTIISAVLDTVTGQIRPNSMNYHQPSDVQQGLSSASVDNLSLLIDALRLLSSEDLCQCFPEEILADIINVVKPEGLISLISGDNGTLAALVPILRHRLLTSDNQAHMENILHFSKQLAWFKEFDKSPDYMQSDFEFFLVVYLRKLVRILSVGHMGDNHLIRLWLNNLPKAAVTFLMMENKRDMESVSNFIKCWCLELLQHCFVKVLTRSAQASACKVSENIDTSPDQRFHEDFESKEVEFMRLLWTSMAEADVDLETCRSVLSNLPRSLTNMYK